jgi:hypothetical protein
MIDRLVQIEEELSQFKGQYQTAVDTLQSHIDETSWTNAKIINAVVFQARVLLAILRFIANRLI